jgi:hypothetical protein
MEKNSTRIVRRSASVPGHPLSPSIAHHHRHVIVIPSPKSPRIIPEAFPKRRSPFLPLGRVPLLASSPSVRPPFSYRIYIRSVQLPLDGITLYSTQRLTAARKRACPRRLRRCYQARHLLRVRSSVVIIVILVIRTAVVALVVAVTIRTISV